MQDHEQRRSLDSGLAKGVLWTGGVKWLIQLASWPITIATANLLSPNDYGYLALVSVITRFVGLLTEAGIGGAIVNGLTLDDDQIRQTNTVSVVAGVVGFALVALVAWPAAVIYEDPSMVAVLVVLGTSVLLEGAAIVPAAMMRRRLDFKRLAVAEGTRNIVDISVTLALAFLGARYWSLVAGYLSGVGVWLVLMRVYSPVAFARPRFERLRELWDFSRHMIGRNVSGFIAYGSDAAIGGLTMSKQALGFYSLGSTLSYAPAEKVTQIVLRVVPAVLGNVRESRTELARYFLSITSVITMLTVPMFVGIAFVAPDLVPLLLGPQWTGLVAVVIPFCVYGVFSELKAVVPHVLQSVGETQALARNGLAALVIMPVAFFVLSRAYGAPGLAAAWAVGSALLSTRLLVIACRRVGVTLGQFVAAVRAPLLGSLVMLIVLMSLRATGWTDDWKPIARLAVHIPIGAAVYVGFILATDLRKVRALVALLRQMRASR